GCGRPQAVPYGRRSSRRRLALRPVAPPLEEDLALALEDDRPVVLHAPVPEADDARIVAVGVTLRDHLAVGREGVTVEHRGADAEPVEAQLRDRVLRGVLRREADHDRAGDEAEDEPLPEGR